MGKDGKIGREEIMTSKKSTKTCPNCGCDKMISFHSLNKKTCADCGYTVVWALEDGQKGVFRDIKRD